MNSRAIIFLFLVLISENVFSQSDTVEFIPIFDSVVIVDDRYQELLDLETESKFIDEQLKEAEERISLLEKHAKIKEDSLRGCLNPIKAVVDSFSLVNVGKYYALIIAVSDYENDKRFPDLPQAIIDGKNLEMVLSQNYVFERIKFLPNPKKDAIIREFDGLDAEVGKDDNVLIFYAGHGSVTREKKANKAYWCPSDAKWENRKTHFTASELLDRLGWIDARNTLLISDACYASSISEPTTRNIIPPKSEYIQTRFNIPSFQYMSSGIDTEVPDDSEFSKNLLDGLRENTEKYLSADDLYQNYLKLSYTKIKNKTVMPQMSPLKDCGHKLGGDFFFIKKDK